MDEQSQGYREIMDWFLIQAKEFQKNAKVVSFEQAGVQLHIDKNTPKQFVPRMPHSAFDGENSTTPRVTTAPTLLGCLIGYNSHRYLNEFLRRIDEKSDKFRGGYDICEIPYEYAIEPNQKLIHECGRTQELWLVSYSPKTVAYKPISIGKMFFQQVTFSVGQQEQVNEFWRLYVFHEKEGGIQFTPEIRLCPGYHYIQFNLKDPNNPSVLDDNGVTTSEITKSQWDEIKAGSAAMLGHTTPKSMSW